MLLLAFLALGYLAILFAFGYAVAVFGLRLRDASGIAGMTAILGSAASLVLVNALAFVLPIALAFRVALLMLMLGACVLWVAHRHRAIGPLAWPPWRVVLTLGLLILLLGLLGARFSGSDPWASFHFPLAATIREGNFPPVELVRPTQPLAYHYGAALLAAFFSDVTGFTVAAGYNLQPMIGVAGMLLLTLSLAWRLSHTWSISLLSSLLALGGAGLLWLKGGGLLHDLWFFLLGERGFSPLRHLADVFSSPLGSSAIILFGHRSNTLGLPFLFGLLVSLDSLCRDVGRYATLAWGLVAVVFAAALALTLETSLVLTLAALAFVLLVPLLERQAAWRIAVYSLVVGVLATAVALLQGGVLSQLLAGGGGGTATLAVGFDGTMIYHTRGHIVALWDPWLWRDLGLPLLLFPFALLQCWRGRRRSPTLLLLASIALLHFAVPWLLRYQPIPGDARRLLLPFVSLSSLLVGLTIVPRFLASPRRWVYFLGWGVVGALLLPSAVYVAVRLPFPTLRAERGPLLAGLPPATAEQQALYQWVRGHTTLRDLFYFRSLPMSTDTVSEEKGLQKDRILFMTYTGRFTVGNLGMWDYPKSWLITVRRVENRCDIEAVGVLGVRYLVVESAERARWYAARCELADWRVVYDGGSGGRPYPRVYEVIRNGR